MTLVSLLGIAVGLVLGLTGAGGGILAVPALVLGLQWSMTQAAPIALIAVGLAALTGALDGLKKGLVRYKAAFLMAIAGAIIAPLGIQLAHRLPEMLLMLLFSLIMLFIAGRMLLPLFRPARSPERPQSKPCQIHHQTGKFIWNKSCLLTIACIGACSGFLTGLLGVGGGFIIVPALQRFTQLQLHSIVATSLMVIALISASTVGVALWRTPHFPAGTWFFVGSVIFGMLLGRALSSHIPARILQASFASLCLVAAAIVSTEAFLLP